VAGCSTGVAFIDLVYLYHRGELIIDGTMIVPKEERMSLVEELTKSRCLVAIDCSRLIYFAPPTIKEE
jgi:hypothetical protein